METLTPFAQVPTTPEAIIAQVRRQLRDDAQGGSLIPASTLERVADQAVRELWGSPVKTFIPVLALRAARERLRDQDMVLSVADQGVRQGPRASPTEAPDPTRVRDDVLPLGTDIVLHDDHDIRSV